jgi:hypothetical protein
MTLREGGVHAAVQGRAVQVDPMKPNLKPPGRKHLKLKCNILLSTSAFKFNLRRHNKEYQNAQLVEKIERETAKARAVQSDPVKPRVQSAYGFSD